MPTPGELQLDRRFGWVIVLFLLLIAGIVGYNARGTANERGIVLSINVAGRQHALAERYIRDVLLKLDGLPADPAEDARLLSENAHALLHGGQVVAVQGADGEVHISPLGNARISVKLEQEQRLLGELIGIGEGLVASGRFDSSFQSRLLQLRIVGAELGSVSNDAVGEMTQAAQSSLRRLVMIELILGAIGAVAAIGMGLLLRRAGVRQAAGFRSLVHNASDLTTVVDSHGTIRYQSPSAQRVLGRRPEELVDTSYASLLHPDDLTRAVTAFADLASRPGATATIEGRFSHVDGSWRQMESTVANLTQDPTVRGLVLNSRDVTERKSLEEELTHQAFHDALTGLANRALFRDRLEHALARAIRNGSALAVLFLDLDGFKMINDSLGHDSGDELLIAVAGRIRSASRASDTVARLGGDEFAMLLEDDIDEDGAIRVAGRLAEAFRPPFAVRGTEVTVTASVGIALATDNPQGSDLLRDADVAMYAAKGRGRGHYALFRPFMYERVAHFLELQGDLQRGLDRGEFILHYQPILDLMTGSVHGLEALIRWNHPTRGMVPPNDFIPAAEETGLIVPIGYWVLQEACRQALDWQQRYRLDDPLSISVNLSTRQIAEPDLVARVDEILRASGLAPRSLILEITETGLMQDVQQMAAKLEQLRALGIRIAIDDFGTGSSSLGYLRGLPVDVLKIDRSFVEGIGGDSEEGRALVRAIVDLAQTLRLDTVAEGIERSGQLNELNELGCESGQGYYFARPLDPQAMSILLEEAGRTGVFQLALERAS